MEKIKGLLKRRSLDIRSTAQTISDMEVVSDPENLSENQPVSSNSPPQNEQEVPSSPPNSSSSTSFVQENDNTRALMMSKIEQLTGDKYSLELTLSDLRDQLKSSQEQNLSLQSKCDDMEKCLDIERRRFRWQQKFYEKRIQQLMGLPTATTIGGGDASNSASNGHLDMSLGSNGEVDDNDEEMMNTSSTLRRLRKYQSIEDLMECNNFYEETIKALVQVQETQAVELNDLKRVYEEKLKALSLEHEAEVTEILESGNVQVEKLIRDNEALIRDLLTGCEGLFDQLKVEFTEEARTNTELKTSSGQNIIVQFKALPTPIKGIVVAGITVISIATAGWASWGFIIWVWPRLIAFAEILAANPETSLLWLVSFLNSVPFQNFSKAWEEGKSLGECLKAFANTEFLSTALRMAPDLFAQFKNFRQQRSIQH